MEVFDDILNKEKLDRNDLELIIQKIKVYEDHIEIQLKADVDSILRCGTLQDVEAAVAAVSTEGSANFPDGTENIEPVTIVQSGSRRPDKVFRANVISDGDPLEIYTDKDGEVIFKKYSLMGGLSEFASQICETLNKTTNRVAAVTDRDSVLAVAGVPRRELGDRRISSELESIMDGRQVYQHRQGDPRFSLIEESAKYSIGLAAPILSGGDVMGCVVFADQEGSGPLGDTEYKLAQTIAGFLGRHMEG
jgi:stage V sporulation protein T